MSCSQKYGNILKIFITETIKCENLNYTLKHVLLCKEYRHIINSAAGVHCAETKMGIGRQREVDRQACINLTCVIVGSISWL